MDIEHQAPPSGDRTQHQAPWLPCGTIQVVTDPKKVYRLKTGYVIFGAIFLTIGFVLMFAQLPKGVAYALTAINLIIGGILFCLILSTDRVPDWGYICCPMVEIIAFINTMVNFGVSIYLLLKEEMKYYKFSIPSMCLGIAMAFYVIRFQEWIQLGQGTAPSSGAAAPTDAAATNPSSAHADAATATTSSPPALHETAHHSAHAGDEDAPTYTATATSSSPPAFDEAAQSSAHAVDEDAPTHAATTTTSFAPAVDEAVPTNAADEIVSADKVDNPATDDNK